MKLSVLSNLFGSRPLEDVLTQFENMGIDAVELGCGGYPGKDHCNPKELLSDDKALENFKEAFRRHHLEIAVLSCHGNPIHPDKKIAKEFDDDFHDAVLLAEKLGIDTIVGFSGCPGGSKEDKTPNWVTCAWPNDYGDILKYQWEEVLVPYWKKTAEFCKAHGVTKIAFEMHPGFCVYNPETLLRLRKEVGDIIGANLDPSHLIWQGIDPCAAIRALEGCIYHFHAKDTKIDKYNTAKFGVLDTKPYTDEIHRSWVFRTVGYGNGQDYWRDIISTLRLVGYDKVISVEHEDSLMSQDEGLQHAVDFLKESMIREPRPSDMRWV